jgi:16S rRNA (guanine966-N2)-methyltransferase
MSHQKNNHSLRIIGGNWRGRKVSFVNNAEIRPTPARVRETLFNWLSGDLQDSRCLELFAGSGILSLEALSRGAGKVTLIEKMQSTVNQLRLEFDKFGVNEDRFMLHCMSAVDWLKTNDSGTYDLIFLDPPFGGVDLGPTLAQICSCNLLSAEGLIYIETAEAVSTQDLPCGSKIIKQKRAASVHYCLITLPQQ